jgi:hypothetical protein
MTQIRPVVVCNDCLAYWDDGSMPRCADPQHMHRPFEMHVHRESVTLPDGAQLVAVSFDDRDPYARRDPPDFALYLDTRWEPPWPHEHLGWPDFGVPRDVDRTVEALGSLLDRARRGERVEIGCLGGHGRTGTALACIAVLGGHPADDAVAWVRERYCTKAVETAEQESFVRRFVAT